ncbi:MAG TPA: transglycosylase domain-containing protein, partial [Actinomycetota bacterium]
MAVRAIPRRRYRSRARARKKARRRSFLGRYWWVWAPPLAAATAMMVALTYVYVSLPLPKAPPAKQTTFLYDRQGNFLKTLHGEVDRVVIPLADAPLHLRQAVIAAEDEDFYSHPGVSLPAIVRAAWANVRGQSIEQGASTITQQYVRNAFPTEFGFLVDPEATEAKGDDGTGVGGFEKSITRKLKEALLAIKIERTLSKNQILERYLNTIYFGRGAYGVEAAAKRYFAVSAKDLTVVQSATLAGLISSPEANNPIQFPEKAKEKRDRVLRLMAEMGFVSKARAAELMQEPVEVNQEEKTRRQKSVTTGTAAYFVDHASRYLQGEYGDQTFIGGLRVTTSIDLKMQRLAEKAVTNHLGQKGDPDVALVAIDPRNGEIRAMIGGKDFRKAKCNLATARGGGDNCGTGRQTGSAFKMFTVAATVAKGISLRSTFSGPGRVVLRDNPECSEWSTRGVSNYSDSGAGTMDLIGATARSVNTIFAQLVAEVGAANVAKMAHKLGIESPLEDKNGFVGCSITLGVHPVSPLEMTTSFATIASGGVRHDPTPVHEVTT